MHRHCGFFVGERYAMGKIQISETEFQNIIRNSIVKDTDAIIQSILIKTQQNGRAAMISYAPGHVSGNISTGFIYTVTDQPIIVGKRMVSEGKTKIRLVGNANGKESFSALLEENMMPSAEERKVVKEFIKKYSPEGMAEKAVYDSTLLLIENRIYSEMDPETRGLLWELHTMDEKQFSRKAASDIRRYLPFEWGDAAYINTGTVKGPSGMKQCVILVRIPGQQEIASVGVRDYQLRYRNDMISWEEMMESIASKIAEDVERKSEKAGSASILEIIKDFEKTRRYVMVDAVGTTQEQGLLEKVPHRTQGDISCIYRIFPYTGEYISEASFIVTNRLLKSYGITEEEIYKVAVRNSQIRRPPRIYTVPDVLTKLFTKGQNIGHSTIEAIRSQSEPYPSEFYSLEDDSLSHGAASLFYPGTLDMLHAKMPSGYYLFPVTDYECIFASKSAITKEKVIELAATRFRELSERMGDEHLISPKVHEYDTERKMLVCMED